MTDCERMAHIRHDCCRKQDVSEDVWRFVELVARGNTEMSSLETMADELMERKAQLLQEDSSTDARFSSVKPDVAPNQEEIGAYRPFCDYTGKPAAE